MRLRATEAGADPGESDTSAVMLSSIIVPTAGGLPSLPPTAMIPQRRSHAHAPSGSVLWRMIEPRSEPREIANGYSPGSITFCSTSS